MSDFLNPYIPTRQLRLNLGCGEDIKPGYVNVDCLPLHPNIQLVDLTKLPLPWKDNSVDEVYMLHCLEHIPNAFEFVGEVRRILRPGGIFHGQVPFANSKWAFIHPQHYRGYWPESFELIAKFHGFDVEIAKYDDYRDNMGHHLRALIPYRVRAFLCQFIGQMFDHVTFCLRKKSP